MWLHVYTTFRLKSLAKNASSCLPSPLYNACIITHFGKHLWNWTGKLNSVLHHFPTAHPTQGAACIVIPIQTIDGSLVWIIGKARIYWFFCLWVLMISTGEIFLCVIKWGMRRQGYWHHFSLLLQKTLSLKASRYERWVPVSGLTQWSFMT